MHLKLHVELRLVFVSNLSFAPSAGVAFRQTHVGDVGDANMLICCWTKNKECS